MKAAVAGVSIFGAGLVGLGFGLVVGTGGVLGAAALQGCDSQSLASGSTAPSSSISSQAPDSRSLYGPDSEAIFQSVLNVAQGDKRVILTMTGISWVESRHKRTASNGASFGPYSAEMPGVVHPDLTVQQAEDIPYITRWIYPQFSAAIRHVDPTKWATNPEAAMEEAGVAAERPHYPYHYPPPEGQGQAAVDQAYQVAISLMHEHGISTDDLGAATVSSKAIAQEASAVNQLSGNTCRSGNTTSPTKVSQLVAFSGATGTRQQVLAAAMAQLNLPYAWGGGSLTGPTRGQCSPQNGAPNDCNVVGFDCSGLTRYAFAQVNITIPRTAAMQWQATKAKTVVPRGGDLAAAQPGDLVFFKGAFGSLDSPEHVGIYIGDGQMINAPQSGENIQVTSITTSYWRDSFVGVTDPFTLAA